MQPSSALCRFQEALHHDRAAAALLDNVRIVAQKAEIAWGHEAVAAERREARIGRTRTAAEMLCEPGERSLEREDAAA